MQSGAAYDSCRVTVESKAVEAKMEWEDVLVGKCFQVQFVGGFNAHWSGPKVCGARSYIFCIWLCRFLLFLLVLRCNRALGTFSKISFVFCDGNIRSKQVKIKSKSVRTVMICCEWPRGADINANIVQFISVEGDSHRTYAMIFYILLSTDLYKSVNNSFWPTPRIVWW